MLYQNFDLEIISPKGSDRLCARVLESPQGDCPFIDVKWPFNADEEGVLLSEIYSGLRQRGRSSRASTIQDFGGKLFEAVFAGDIKRLFRSSLDASSRAGHGLRLRLRLPEDSVLHARPWEFLFDTESREFLAVREHTPLVRYLPVAQPIPPMAVEGPLRILVALSSPTDHPRLDIAREWEILCNALEPSISAGQLELRRVPGRCTFDNVRDSLRHFGAHIFHFVGHGIPGALVLEQESSKGLEMEASHLRSAFPGGALPRLIVLNACSGAITQDVPFSGLAQGFLRQGVPAVVAMQASITDDAALIFARYFYRDLVETGAVDASLTEARLRMQGNGHPIEWGTPVLYMRAPSGQLFQPAAKPVESNKSKETLEKASVSLAHVEQSASERKKPRESQQAQEPPPLPAGAGPAERKKPRTSRTKETKPPSTTGPAADERSTAKKTQAKTFTSPVKPEPEPGLQPYAAEQDLTIKMAPRQFPPPATAASDAAEHAGMPAQAPDRTMPNAVSNAAPGETASSLPPPHPGNAPKIQLWEFAVPPAPELAAGSGRAEQASAAGNRMGELTAPFTPKPPAAEKNARPRPQVRKHMPAPTQEPILGEPDIPPPVQPKGFGPVFILEPEADARSGAAPRPFTDVPPPQEQNWGQPAPAKHFLVPGLAAGLLVAVLGATVGKSYIFPSHDRSPPALAPAAPAPAATVEPAPATRPEFTPAPIPKPAVAPTPALLRGETARIAGGAGDQVKPVPDAQPAASAAKRKPAAPPARKIQPKSRSAPAAAAPNCKSPIPSERDAACLFK